MEYQKALEDLGPNSIHQFSVSQAEKSSKSTVLDNQQDIKVYRKVPKFSDPRKLCCNMPKIQTKRVNIRVFRQKDESGSGSDLGLHCLPGPDLSVQNLRSLWYTVLILETLCNGEQIHFIFLEASLVQWLSHFVNQRWRVSCQAFPVFRIRLRTQMLAWLAQLMSTG